MEEKKKVKLVLNSPLNNESSKDITISFKRKNKYFLTEGGELKFNRKNKMVTKSTRKFKFYRPVLERTSVVYELAGNGDEKFKNYDKISGDIRRLERLMKKEKERYLRSLKNKNLRINDGSSSESNTIDEELNKNKKSNELEKYNILEVIQKFRIPPENRTVEDLYITKNFILQTKLIEHYMEELNNDKRMIENLATFFGLEFRYQKFEKNETIYKIDDYADNFYMILLGKVNILKVEPKVVKKTGYDYFCYIMNLKKNNERYRYKMCVEENNKVYPISLDEDDLLPYFFLYFILEDIKEGKNIDNFNKILQIINIRPKELGLVESKINSMEYILDKEKSITKKIRNFPKDKIKEYKFIYDKKVKKDVTLYEYVKIKSIDALSYFGNESIELGTNRTETVVCAETTELIYIINKLYITNILPKKAIIIEKRTAFLGKNYLFNKITPKKFVKKYYNLFTLETYLKGDVLFEENGDLEYIYFIKEGHVNLLTTKSILEMEMFINEINKKLKQVQNIFNNNNNSEDEKNIVFYNNIKSSTIELFEHIKKREKIKIFILKENEDAGLVSYLLGIGPLLTGIVDSRKAVIYKIKKDDLTGIFKKEKLCFYELINRVEDKLKVISQRFYEINNIKLSMADKKIMEENNYKYSLIPKNKNEIFDIFPTSNNTKVNTDKIKEIVNNHDLNKYYKYHKNSRNSSNPFFTLPNLSNKLINTNSANKIKNLKAIIQQYKLSEKKIKKTPNVFKRSSLLIEEHINKHKASLKNRIKKMLYYKKKFPFEEEFLNKISENINDLLENKFIMTRKSKMNDTNETSNIRENNSIDNTENDDNLKTNRSNTNNILGVKNKFLITQLDDFNQKITSNHFFTQKGNNRFFDKRYEPSLYTNTLASCRNIFQLNNYRNTILARSKDYKRINTINNCSTNSDIFSNEYCLNVFRKNKIIQSIKHPYISPLTLIKLNKYKMIDEKDKFKENKERYDNNIIKNYKKRGLNQFGYPISYDKTLSRKYTYNNIKLKK